MRMPHRFVIGICSLLAACGAGSTTQPVGTVGATAIETQRSAVVAPATGIVIDRNNTLRAREPSDTDETVDVLGVVAFGDLDGDGVDDAAASVVSGPTVGAGSPRDAVNVIVLLRRGDRFEPGTFFGESTLAGDEGYHLTGLRIEGGQLWVRTLNCQGADECDCEGDACCDDIEVANRLVGGRIEPIVGQVRVLRESTCHE